MNKLTLLLVELQRNGKISFSHAAAILGCCETIHEATGQLKQEWITSYGTDGAEALVDLMVDNSVESR